jgi:hypothetical protein
MALEIEYTDPGSGVMLGEAYVRVRTAYVDYDANRAELTIGIFRDATARGEGLSPAATRFYTIGGPAFVAYFGVDVPAETAPTLRAVIYGFLKTLPEYKGAFDV